MKIWLLQPSEILPLKEDARLMRMGLLAEELCRNKENQVTWFTSSFDHFRKKQLFDKDTVYHVKDNYNLQILYAKGYKKNISISRIINHKVIAIKLKKEMRKMEKPDIIFVSFPTIEFALEAVKYGEKFHVPVIVDIRDLWPDNFKQNLSGIIKIMSTPYIWLLNKKTKKILHDAYKITGVSELVVNWGLRKGNREKSSLDKHFFIGYKKKKLLMENSKSNKKFDICFFATINNQFNYDIVSEIGKSLANDDIHIVVCGDGPNFNDLVTKCDGVHNIDILGWCDANKLNQILLESSVGLAPYKDTFDFRMGVSNKFCEYLSRGLPVVVTSGGYMKDIVEKYHIGMSSMDVKKIKKFILDLKNDSNKWQKMRKSAIELYNKYFDAEIIYPELVKYIKDVWEEYYK